MALKDSAEKTAENLWVVDDDADATDDDDDVDADDTNYTF